nr:NAD-dependent epimerase/dehydratase family protein [uncultured Pseudodesulfovibrio sp.]
MAVVIVTGSCGLIGAETVRFYIAQGFDVVGVDNNMRSYFFGKEASTKWSQLKLESDFSNYSHENIDIRDEKAVDTLFAKYNTDISAIIHTAAQPSHDWAAREPITDFSVNANGTLVMLEATRKHCPKAAFIFTSTNKVYGDTPNFLPLVEQQTRWELDPSHEYAKHGIDEHMSIDSCTHSLFGVSKAAADLLVQEYGRYFNMNTGVFRGGCLTGGGHSGTELHGFLSYLVRCCMTGRPYTVFGYKGKQVRDNIHSSDLVNMLWNFHQNPRPGEVYNVGGSRHSNCSMLEAIQMSEEFIGKKMQYTYSDENRIGDHIWYISDVRKFQEHYPQWSYTYDIKAIIKEVIAGWQNRDTK